MNRVRCGRFFGDELEGLRKRTLDRHLREITSAQGPEVVIAGRHFINFSSIRRIAHARRSAAVGAIGPNGRGLAAAENVSEEVDIQMGTLSKALGASGAYICGSRVLIEWLLNRARSFIYSTAPAPAIAGPLSPQLIFFHRIKGKSADFCFGKELD